MMNIGVQTKLMLLFVFIFVTIASGILMLKYRQSANINKIYMNAEKNKNIALDRVINTKNAELLKIATKSSNNASQLVSYLNPDMALVYNAEGNILYSSFKKIKTPPAISKKELQNLFNQPPPQQFFIKSGSDLIQINAAHFNENKNYILIGTLWDRSFITDISQKSDSNVRLAPVSNKPVESGFFDRIHGIIAFSRFLYDFNGKPVIQLHIQTAPPELEEINSSLKQQLTEISLFGTMILAVLFISLFWWVSKPLALITQSLNHQDISHINCYLKNGSEFGIISRMIKQFFEQKIELQKSRDELEVRVQERTNELKSSNDLLKLEISAHKKAEEEKDRLQARLIQSEKLAALGELSSEIAHEVKNPLGVILGFSQFLLLDIKNTDKNYEPLKTIETESKRCRDFLEGILAFSRKSSIEKIVTDLNTEITKTLPLIEAKTKTHGVTIKKFLFSNLPLLNFNPTQIQQVILNLAGNAVDSMKPGGELTIQTSLVSKNGNSFVAISVKDTGSGIPENIREQVFDPFFTTKETGKGTGLGLALVKEIVLRHSGTIDFHTEIGAGTTFTVLLPA